MCRGDEGRTSRISRDTVMSLNTRHLDTFRKKEKVGNWNRGEGESSFFPRIVMRTRGCDRRMKGGEGERASG